VATCQEAFGVGRLSGLLLIPLLVGKMATLRVVLNDVLPSKRAKEARLEGLLSLPKSQLYQWARPGHIEIEVFFYFNLYDVAYFMILLQVFERNFIFDQTGDTQV
jgi:hypothetical protein